MTQSPFARAGIGFLVAAASVLVFHQGMIFVLKTAGLVNAPIYGTNPVGPLGVPLIVNQMFWGGLYGAAFGALLPRLPRPPIAPGLVLGLIAGLVSMFVVAPIKGNPGGRGGRRVRGACRPASSSSPTWGPRRSPPAITGRKRSSSSASWTATTTATSARSSITSCPTAATARTPRCSSPLRRRSRGRLGS